MTGNTMRRVRTGVIACGLLLVALALAPWPSVAAGPQPAPALGLGRIDATTKERLQHVWQAGRALGRRTNVLAKVGDSITSSGSFLSDAGDGNAILSTHRELASIIAYYRAVTVDRQGGAAHNSLNRHSLAAGAGWTGADILGQRGSGSGPAPLAREYAALNPAVAVIMFGSNDLIDGDLEAYRRNLADVVEGTLRQGIIPVLSTIPDRLAPAEVAGRAPLYNQAVRDLAALEHVPLIDYWAALQPLSNRGLGRDLVHPSIYPGRARSSSVTFTAAGLRYGWTLRNYLTLAELARLKAIVFDNGAPDP